MQIIIPMSGFGERFRRAGYSVPKPLIEIDGKPIIGHVIDMFPGETDFIFICNRDHLNEPGYQMEAILRRYCPTGRIVGIEPHKLGPVHAVLQVADLIDPARPVVVNYCDFTCYWQWSHFRDFVESTACDGAIPAYKGFHPHSLGTTNYAYLQEGAGWVQDIQEKQPYTDNRMQEYASSGTYYFRSGRILLDSLRETIAQNLTVGGEFYVSLAYKPLLAKGGTVTVYALQHFMQWGTPEDVTEYQGWSNAFRLLATGKKTPPVGPDGAVVIPMAGLGQRFSSESYMLTKPLIPVSGRPMVVQATRDLPAAERHVFVMRRDMPGFDMVRKTLLDEFPAALTPLVAAVTEGQACTALIGLETLEDIAGPVIFGACDNGVIYESARFKALLAETDVDVVVWAVRGHANAARHPTMYGWIELEDGSDHIRSISVKKPLDNPLHDPVVLGTFAFRHAEDFRRCVERMMTREARVNGEFYIDTCINDALALGLRCRMFEVDSYISWGTPNDLRTFEYWQSCFHKWEQHPYRLEKDSHVPTSAAAELDLQYAARLPALPGSRP